jgi:hypothetical protein
MPADMSVAILTIIKALLMDILIDLVHPETTLLLLPMVRNFEPLLVKHPVDVLLLDLGVRTSPENSNPSQSCTHPKIFRSIPIFVS